ncbi:predicted protein [Verticillium alfalfae VaMs.102]|uniref:Predicted protein n=1 Tax=Verticillium alfalfae (strain VaMs.102 / ATCC MYA-4576 / FGSC 10136) TaxID=526221 RepID=C9SU66_VERA1|nr:predicted protein [Verticillium alfalfae VaMs.102]EEY22377.1 predicted protein [Verticillium alfalfae VaMs.102]
MFLKAPLLLAFSAVPFCLAQDALPSQTLNPIDGIRVAAIRPTEAGQIGIDPVDIPPDESMKAPIGVDTQYLTELVTDQQTKTAWVHSESAFGVATITTKGPDGSPQTTTIPEGFRVAMVDGKVEVTLSQWLKDKLNGLSQQLPSCSLRKRREWDYRQHNVIERRAPPDIPCVRQRVNRLNQLLREDPDTMRQMVRLNEQVAQASGSDAVALAESEQMMAFAEEDIVFEIIHVYEVVEITPTAGELLATVGEGVLGVLGSIAFFFGTVNILEDLWKLRADPQPMPFFKNNKPNEPSDPGSCPEAQPACEGERCKGGSNAKCTAEWKDCDCVVSSVTFEDGAFFGDAWEAVEDEVSQFVFGSDPNADIPKPNCQVGTGEDNTLANVESDVWSKLLDNLCVGKTLLSGGIHETKKTSDIGLTSYEGWEFEFILEMSREKDCSAYNCVDVFGKFTSCSYDSHTKYKTGELPLDCGTAKYIMHDPKDSEPEPDPTPAPPPKTSLTLQNDFCYGRDDFGSHGDVHESWVSQYSGWACAGTALKTVQAGKPDTFLEFYTVTNDAPYWYKVWWKDGCELEGGQTEAYASNPLMEENPGYTKCQEILIDNYKRCNNGGVGGNIQAGCLVYEFKAQRKE